MHFDVSTIIPAVAFVLYVSFVIFGFFQYKKDRYYWSFQLYMILLSIWSFGSMMMHLNSPVMTPLFWNRIMLLGLLAIPFPLCSFVLDILSIRNKAVRLLINISYVLIIPLMHLNFTGSIVSDAGFADGIFYYQLADGAMSAYSLSYAYLVLTIVLLLFGADWRGGEQVRKNITLPLVGVLVMLIGIFMNLFPTLGKYPIDIFAAAVNAVLIFYSIYKYKLINYSKVAISFLYSTILVAVASLTFLLIFLVIQHFSTRFNVGNILQLSFILGVSTTIIIHPLRNLLLYLIDTVILPRRHPYQKTIRELSRRLTTIVNLNELGDEVVKSLASGMKSDWVLFVARRNRSDSQFFLIAEARCPSCTEVGSEVEMTFPPALQRQMTTVVYTKGDDTPWTISSQIPPVDVIISLACRGEVCGYILIGYDRQATVMSEIEREALEILASHCSLSLENALSFERLRVQGEELVMSNNKLEAIFNGIASPVCLIDNNYIINEANTAALSFVGKGRDELIGSKCYDSLFGRDRPCSHCLGLECIHTGAMQEEEVEIGNSYLSFQFHSVRSADRSRPVFIEIIADVTEHRHLQQELVRTEKMAGIGTLASGIAHELNNPLAGIVGTAEIMLSDERDEESREYLSDILSYAKGASNVIKELAIYSRTNESVKSEPVELIPTLEFALRLAQRGSDHSAIEVRRNYHALPTIEANEAQLQQLFLNLLVNALQAMEGEGVLTLTCLEQDGFVQVKIADTGYGIAEEHINQIFTPFFTTKEPGSGTGLGLSNCYTIMERMGGRIRVQSEVGVGSEFTTLFVSNEEMREEIRFHLATEKSELDDVFFIQRKVLVGEKGYLDESIHRSEDEKAIHILAVKGLQPVGTVSLMTSEHFWPLPISSSFDITPVLKTDQCAEIIRLAVLPQMRNTSASIGLIILVFLLSRALGVKELVIDVFADDAKTIKLYRKFGFEEVGSYSSPSDVTVMALLGPSTLETDQGQLNHFVKPLFRRLRPLFDFGPYTEAVHQEMDRILSNAN
ncbi:MAG: GNAT family N-acetyltransferase [Sphaerochaeta sp.]|nr:GNAT family N-acetyltransferase [Sphaerochaeta sp.]